MLLEISSLSESGGSSASTFRFLCEVFRSRPAACCAAKWRSSSACRKGGSGRPLPWWPESKSCNPRLCLGQRCLYDVKIFQIPAKMKTHMLELCMQLYLHIINLEIDPEFNHGSQEVNQCVEWKCEYLAIQALIHVVRRLNNAPELSLNFLYARLWADVRRYSPLLLWLCCGCLVGCLSLGRLHTTPRLRGQTLGVVFTEIRAENEL